MAKYSNTKAKINEKIATNGRQAVTGGILNDVLQTMVDSLGADYQFGGLVQPGSSFTAGEQPVVFLATTPGTYTNFGGLVVADGEVALLVWSGSAWSKQTPDIATRTEVSQLGQQFNFSNNGNINRIIKELYLPGIDTSLIKMVRFFKSIKIGTPYYSGILFVDDSYATIVSMRLQTASLEDANAFISHEIMTSPDANNYYAVVDWSKIGDGQNVDYVGSINAIANKLDYSPTIKFNLEGIFDVSSLNNSTYANVTAAATAVPFYMRRGGMILRFRNTQNITEIWENVNPDWYSFTEETSWKNTWKSIGELEEDFNAQGISNNTELNGIISELFVQNGDPLNSNIDAAVFFKAFMINGAYRTGVAFINRTTNVEYAVLYKDYSTQNEALAAAKETIFTDGINYALIDFSKVTETSTTTAYIIRDVSLNDKALDLNYSPSINSYIKTNDLISSIAVNVNDVSYWKHLQNSVGADILNACETTTPIRCKPGHRYLLECSDEFTSDVNRYLYMHIYTGKDEKSITNDLGAQRIDNNNMHFVTPHDAKYLKIVLQHIANDQELTPEGAYNSNIRLFDVTFHSITSFGEKLINYTYDSNNYANGIEIYGGLVFQGMSSGNIDIYDLSSKELLQSVPVSMPSGETGVQHFNNMCFGEKDSAEDEFPILWISPNPGGKIVGIAITRNGNTFTFVNKYEIVAPWINSEYIGDVFFDFKSKRLVRQAYHKNTSYAEGSALWYGNSGFSTHAFEDLRDVTSVTDYTSTQIKTIKRRLWAVQDGFVSDDNLFMFIGIPNQRMVIACYNINREDIVKEWDLREPQYGIGNDEEPEGLCLYNGIIYISTTKGLYKIGL